MARTATQPSRCSGETVGPSRPGVSATASSTPVLGHVVVHHHVGARDEDAVEAPLEHLEALGVRRAGAGDQHRLGLEDRRRRRSPARRPSGCCRSRRRRRSRRPRRAGCWSRRRRRGGSPRRRCRAPRDDGAPPRRTTWRCACRPGRRARSSVPGRAAKRNRERPKPSRTDLLGLGAGVEQQVAAGDADVEGALADVERDVARAQVEELHAVGGVEQAELLGVAALAVAGLAQDLGGGGGQRALVGDGDPQQRLPCRSGLVDAMVSSRACG